MAGEFIANEFRSTMICIDDYDKLIMKGRIYNPSLPGALPFQSVMQMLLSLEDLLNNMNFPQHFSSTRSFRKTEQELPKTPQIEQQRGRQGDFLVKVLFRQNASWQGSVTWLNEGREEAFRSTWELLLLMHSVLAEQRSDT